MPRTATPNRKKKKLKKARRKPVLDPMVGDSVRVRRSASEPETVGRKAMIKKLVGRDGILVQLQDGDAELVVLQAAEVTNFSLAARKAWTNMPDRKVGRPVGTAKSNRVSVTLRIDRKLWKQFRKLEASGEITDRTGAINAWIKKELEKITDGVESKSSDGPNHE